MVKPTGLRSKRVEQCWQQQPLDQVTYIMPSALQLSYQCQPERRHVHVQNVHLDDCEAYLYLAVEDRRKFLMANHLCFGCYGHTSRNHDVRSCRRRGRCRTCGKLHRTGVHGFRSAQQSRQEVTVQASSDFNETQPKVVQSYATETANESVAMNMLRIH